MHRIGMTTGLAGVDRVRWLPAHTLPGGQRHELTMRLTVPQ